LSAWTARPKFYSTSQRISRRPIQLSLGGRHMPIMFFQQSHKCSVKSLHVHWKCSGVIGNAFYSGTGDPDTSALASVVTLCFFFSPEILTLTVECQIFATFNCLRRQHQVLKRHLITWNCYSTHQSLFQIDLFIQWSWKP